MVHLTDHDELLSAAIDAHRKYEAGVAELKAQRTKAFKRALTGTVTARELSRQTGMSDTQATRISQGKA